METTNNANLDLFIQLVRSANKPTLNDLLNKSWEENKLKTIAIIFNSRDRIGGKKEKDVSNFCLSWLKKNYNEIYKMNVLTYINKYGCWNDLNYVIKTNYKNNYEYKLFANQLKEDKNALDENRPISLCAKWVINANTDHTIKIARYLFDDIKNYHEKYRKEYLKPLRQKLELVETKICNNDWENVNYNKIPAGALKYYKKLFIKKDGNNYSNFIKDLTENNKKIKITGLLPHQIIKTYLDNMHNDDIDETLELEWKTLVSFYTDMNINSNDDDSILPVVDVSGSMFCFSNKKSTVMPVTVSIALGLLLAEINKGIYHNKVITFSEKPQIFEVRGKTLKDKIKCLRDAEMGFNTNFLKIADLLINNNLTCKRLICFTDMQFDVGQHHNLFIEKFKNNGLEVPELIYWNLSGEFNNFPINDTNTNTSILSGFSEQFLKIILEKDALDAPKIMNKILEPYYEFIKI
jgi:hypothetical protein